MRTGEAAFALGLLGPSPPTHQHTQGRVVRISDLEHVMCVGL